MENIKNTQQMFSKMLMEQNKATMVKYIAYFIIVILVIGMGAYIINKIRLNNNNCKTLDQLYKGFPMISSIKKSLNIERNSLLDPTVLA